VSHPFYRTSSDDAVFSMTMFWQTPPPQPAIDTSALKRCYVSAGPTDTEPIHVRATNFDPTALINIYFDNVLQPVKDGTAPPQADAAGTLDGSISAPFQPNGQRAFVLRLDQANQEGMANAPRPSVQLKVTALEVSSTPANASTSSLVRFRGRGFTDPLNPIYAHYILKGKSYADVRIGKPHYACGQFSVKRRQFPFKNPRTGVWTIQFDQSRTYGTQPAAYTTLRVHVQRKSRTR
jgi:hypothetical protein